jgi:ParB family chromosome partitioning protein
MTGSPAIVTDPADTIDVDICDALDAVSPPRTFLYAELHKSALNVRTNAEDADATDALEASIARRGLLQPLVVHAAGDGAPTPWGVLGGGRRLRAIGRLIEAGRLPADWPITASVFTGSEAEITEMSLGENLLRRQLREYEVHAAIAAAVDRGDSVEAIAGNLGQTRHWVARQLRLGRLAPPILAAYRAGDFGSDIAMAYAATEDQALQLLVFESLAHQPSYIHNASRIRAALKVGDHETRRLLLFVGEAIYLGRGGAIEPDLFADGRDARVRIADEELLRRLVEERLDVERARIRDSIKRPDLRFVPQPPQFAGRTDQPLEIRANGKLPAGDVVATVDIGDEGELLTRFWWASRAAKGAAERGGAEPAPTPSAPSADRVGANVHAGEALAMPDSDYAQYGRAIARDEYGLTADGLQLVRSLRRALLRRLLLESSTGPASHVARNYLVWAQARALFASAIASQTGMRRIVDEWNDNDREPVGLWPDFGHDVVAEQDWQAAIAELREADFMVEKDPAASLQLYLELPPHARRRTEAIVAGAALLRSADTPGWRIAAHDVVARACGADAAQLRRWWTPTGHWLGLFGKLFRLAAAQPFVDQDTHAGMTKLKDADLTIAAATALIPENRRDPDMRDRAARWLPAILAFGPDPAPADAPPEPPPDPVAAQREKVKTTLRGRANAAKVREAVS